MNTIDIQCTGTAVMAIYSSFLLILGHRRPDTKTPTTNSADISNRASSTQRGKSHSKTSSTRTRYRMGRMDGRSGIQTKFVTCWRAIETCIGRNCFLPIFVCFPRVTVGRMNGRQGWQSNKTRPKNGFYYRFFFECDFEKNPGFLGFFSNSSEKS